MAWSNPLKMPCHDNLSLLMTHARQGAIHVQSCRMRRRKLTTITLPSLVITVMEPAHASQCSLGHQLHAKTFKKHIRSVRSRPMKMLLEGSETHCL